MGLPSVVDTGKLLELRYVNGLSFESIADLVGLSTSAVYQRLKRFEPLMARADTEGQFQARESNILAGLRADLLAHMANGLSAENAQDKVSPYQAVGMYGILFDKQRLLDGKSTANIAALTRIIEVSQESGDSALRKQSIEIEKAKIIKPDE